VALEEALGRGNRRHLEDLRGTGPRRFQTIDGDAWATEKRHCFGKRGRDQIAGGKGARLRCAEDGHDVGLGLAEATSVIPAPPISAFFSVDVQM
jgi:hypothetical protein